MAWKEGFAGLECLCDTGDGAAGIDTGDQDIDLSVGGLPDLLGGGEAVGFRVGWVFELLRNEAVRLVG